MTTTLTVCTTCKRAGEAPPEADTPAAGARLADALEVAARNRDEALSIVRYECLWACAEGCAILIRGKGKTGYIAGRFAPTAEAAAAILDWAAAYEQSPSGAVRYALWPEGMKGHFIARVPE